MDPLQQLRDIHEPIPVSWWPPAPGWWILALAALALLAWLAWYWYRSRQAGAFRRIATSALRASLANGTHADRPAGEFLRELLEILRRTVLSSPYDHRPAALTSPELLRLLDQSSGGRLGAAMDLRELSNRLYRDDPSPLPAEHAQLLVEVCRQWIKSYRGQPPETPGPGRTGMTDHREQAA